MPVYVFIPLLAVASAAAFWTGYRVCARHSARALSECRQSQDHLRKLIRVVEQSPSTVMITDLKGAIEYVNPKFTELTGYTVEEVLGKNPSILNSGHTPDAVYAEMWRTITAGDEWRGEFLNQKKNGELYWEYASICSVRDASGAITHYVAVKEDITARKHAEEALRSSEAQNTAMLAAFPDLVLSFNREGQHLDVRGNTNGDLMVTVGGATAIKGRTLYDLLPQTQARLLHDAIQRVLDTGEMQVVEYTLGTVSGQLDFEARLVPSGPDRVIAVARDITTRRQLETALHISESKYRSVSERADDGIAIVQDEIIQYCNPRLPQMMGFPVEAVIGKSFRAFIAPEALEQVSGNYARRMRGENNVPARYEARLLCHDGQRLDVEINSSLMEYEGRPAVLAFVRDISERKRAEAERERLINELHDFAHTVAHDLKSPLHGLIGYASLLADGLDGFSEKEVAEYLRVIERYGFKMNAIIDDMLLLSSVQSLDEVAVEPLDMSAIVTDALTRLDYVVREKDAIIEQTASTWPIANGYTSWVEQVWVNYLSNALKYGGEQPHITLGAEQQRNGYVRFWVRDRGPGISAKDQARLFTRFTRVGKMKVEGHGLGLSIVQRIVTRLGGEVGVVSTEGAGAEFYFTLPVAVEFATQE